MLALESSSNYLFPHVPIPPPLTPSSSPRLPQTELKLTHLLIDLMCDGSGIFVVRLIYVVRFFPVVGLRSAYLDHGREKSERRSNRERGFSQIDRERDELHSHKLSSDILCAFMIYG